MKTKAYHNTTKLTGAELWESEYKALKQDDVVLNVFRSKCRLPWTPEWVLMHLRIVTPLSEHDRWHNTPITSIRRSFSNLQRKGLIEKTGDMVEGNYGKPVHTWRLIR